MPDQREQLRKIKTFPSLVKYLRDELDWPIGSDDFEDLTFDYTPEEIGLDAATAAKIDQIKRLRPLTATQPWGIFFVKFEPKQLPVLALRRILNRVITKKRASANPSEMASWELANLMLVSSYGEGDNRQISFAHFTQPEEGSRLPPLKVLGWDSRDTPLHLDHVADVLAEQLTWPDDEEDTDAWLERWRSAFALTHRGVITTSRMLSVELAKLARSIRERINTVLTIEPKDGQLTKLFDAFRESLIHDLEHDDFADMYAQTITYGLLSARIADPSHGDAGDFAATTPVTNPFLKELMEAFLDAGQQKPTSEHNVGFDFDELGLGELVELLDAADIESVVRDFGDQNPLENPIIHFYEHFLREYDPDEKKKRGVFYTPLPIVSFIVQSVDELFRTEFGLEEGLADTTTWQEMVDRLDDLEIPEGTSADQAFVQILDPATGTGTFLVEVIDLIYRTKSSKWRAEGHGPDELNLLWNEYVPTHLLPRLHGYESMMAPYAIAHLNIGLKLYETGYRFRESQRVQIYLTNTLDQEEDLTGQVRLTVPALAHETAAANQVKKETCITAILGNPPYSLHSANLEPEHRALVEPYKFIGPDRIKERGALQLEKNLNDDYVKFIRYAQNAITDSSIGIFCLITNHSYLDNPTMRGMRWNLMESATQVFLLDLHGNTTKSEQPPDGSTDEPVFEIKQGVAIIVLARTASGKPATVRHGELWGSRAEKESWLLTHSLADKAFSELAPSSANYLFIPQETELREEYEAGISLTDVMPTYGAGYITARDNLVVDFDSSPLIERISAFKDSPLQDDELLSLFEVSAKRGWDLSRSREILSGLNVRDHVIPTNYRPFDERAIFFHSSLVWGCSWPTHRHMVNIDGNLSLLATRLTKDKWDVMVSRQVSSHKALSAYDTNSIFPLFLAGEDVGSLFDVYEGLEVNLSQGFQEALATRIGIEGQLLGDPSSELSPEDVFHYIYAIFQSPSYRSRYHDFLTQDFPRIPLPRNRGVFQSLAALGNEIVSLHLFESPELNQTTTTLVGSGDFLVEKVSYDKSTVWLDTGRTRGFSGVPKEIWDYRIGGYQVCEKWLKDKQAKGGKNPRPGRVLSSQEIEHYQKIVVTLAETVRVMSEIDGVIERAGGWPGAFLGRSSQQLVSTPATCPQE